MTIKHWRFLKTGLFVIHRHLRELVSVHQINHIREPKHFHRDIAETIFFREVVNIFMGFPLFFIGNLPFEQRQRPHEVV